MADPNTDFNPAFGGAMERLQAAAAARGIKTHFISGVRSPEDQRQLYANYQAGRAGKPLPYPERGAVSLAAPPGASLHERGLAADLVADDPSRQAELRSLGPQFGLRTIGPKDPNHFELGATMIAKAPAYTPGTTINASSAPVDGVLASRPAAPETVNEAVARRAQPSFYDALANIESNNQNIYSRVDKDVAGPNTRSQGYFQINTPTWQEFAAKAGIDLEKYPNAMSAPREIQQQVAALIPFSRFGPRTQKMLNQQFGGNLDTKATIGTLASNVGGGGAAPAVSTQTAAAAPQSLWSKLTTPPTDPKTGQPSAAAKSPLQEAAEAFSPSAAKAQTGKEMMEEQAPEKSALSSAGPGARNVSPGLQNISQTYGQTINSLSRPLTWSSAPSRFAGMAPAGSQPLAAGQVPGISLTSVQPGSEGLGWGIDPTGYGYG